MGSSPGSLHPMNSDGRPFWILGLSAFTVAAAIQSQPLASQAWGLATLFSGGVLFLYSARSPRIIVLPILGLVGISALPYTPAWRGTGLFAALHPAGGGLFHLGTCFTIGGILPTPGARSTRPRQISSVGPGWFTRLGWHSCPLAIGLPPGGGDVTPPRWGIQCGLFGPAAVWRLYWADWCGDRGEIWSTGLTGPWTPCAVPFH